MEKYEKPTVLDLSVRGRYAEGQRPQVCISGSAAGQFESCGNGGAATWGCQTGSAASGKDTCFGGSNANNNQGDCMSGTAVSFACEAGSGGSSDPYGCVNGPSFMSG